MYFNFYFFIIILNFELSQSERLRKSTFWCMKFTRNSLWVVLLCVHCGFTLRRHVLMEKHKKNRKVFLRFLINFFFLFLRRFFLGCKVFLCVKNKHVWTRAYMVKLECAVVFVLFVCKVVDPVLNSTRFIL